MLTIKRVPTLVSNYQEDDASQDNVTLGCGRNCLGKCCLPGTFSLLLLFRLFSFKFLEHRYILLFNICIGIFSFII